MPAEHGGTEDAPVHTFGLTPGASYGARVSLGDEPASDLEVRIRHSTLATLTDGGEGHAFRAVHLSARTGDGGELRAGFDPERPAVITCFPGPALLERLPRSERHPTHPVILLDIARGTPAGTAPERLDLARLTPLDLEVRAPEGTPADGPRLAVAARTGSSYEIVLNCIGAGRTGRVRVFVPALEDVLVCAWSPGACCVVPVAATDRLEGPLELRMQAVASVARVLRNEKGDPVPRAELPFFVTGEGGPAATLASALRPVRVTSAGDGSFRLPVYPALRYSLSYVVLPHGSHYVDRIEFTAGDPPDTLVVTLDRR